MSDNISEEYQSREVARATQMVEEESFEEGESQTHGYRNGLRATQKHDPL